mgnify:CR=1 FL=1
MDFDKMNGLVPAIIQDADTAKVLMLGFMNKEAYDKTVETGKVTFFSRTKNRLWTKGEESGNFLNVVSIKEDCDRDTLLVQVHPVGPVCHTGTDIHHAKRRNKGWNLDIGNHNTIDQTNQCRTQKSSKQTNPRIHPIGFDQNR